jgi:tetratricopeptide (TPR) repeat protein
MRARLLFLLLLLTLTVHGATPEVGKDALRKLVKLPAIGFPPSWTFDPARGFIFASATADAVTEISDLRNGLSADPADPETFLRLGQLYSVINDDANAQKNFSRAAQLYRQRVVAQSDDVPTLTAFGQALQGSGKTEEAESVLRKAVHLDAKSWKSLIALAQCLDAAARSDINDTAPLASADVSRAQHRLDESDDLFNRAVALAPEESTVYRARGLHRCLRATILNQIRVAQGESDSDVFQAHDHFSPQALADLQRASQLAPRNYALIGSTALFEIYTVASQNGEINWRDFSWSTLPDSAQRSLRQSITRLENLGEDPHSHQAAGALETLAILQGPVLHQTQASLDTLRSSLILDPTRDEVWENLLATLAQTEHYQELLTACEDHAKQKDSSRSHLLLAKAYEKLGRWDDVESEVIESVRQAPNDFTANLALAALFLRHGENEEALTEADGWLSHAEQIMGDINTNRRDRQQVIDLTLTRSIYYALTDETETARHWAQAVINQDKNNKLAQEILSAMDY